MLFECILMPSSHPLVEHIQAAARKYDQAVKAAGKGHTHGGPSAHILMATVDALIDIAKDEERIPVEERKMTPVTIARISAEKIRLSALPLHMVEAECTQFKMKEAYQKGAGGKKTMKLTMEVRHPGLLSDIIHLACALGAEHKVGTEPPGALERYLSRSLEDILK